MTNRMNKITNWIFLILVGLLLFSLGGLATIYYISKKLDKTIEQLKQEQSRKDFQLPGMKEPDEDKKQLERKIQELARKDEENFYKILELEHLVKGIDPEKRLFSHLRKAWEADLNWKMYGAPPAWIIKPFLLKALSLDDPVFALQEFEKLPWEQEEDLKVKSITASFLAETLQGENLNELITSCKNTGSKEACFSAASVLPVTNSRELEDAISLVDVKDSRGLFIALVLAAQAQDAGVDIARLREICDPLVSDLPSTHPAVFLHHYLESDISAIVQTVKNLEFQKDSGYIVKPLSMFMQRGDPGSQMANKIADDLVLQSGFFPESQRISLCGLLAAILDNQASLQLAKAFENQGVPDDIDRFLQSASQDKLIQDSFYIYSVAKLLVESGNNRGTEIAIKMAERITGFREPEDYYHLLGTLCGLVALQDTVKAIEISKYVKTLEWHVNARRCLYRSWAKKDPEAARKDIKMQIKGESFVDKKIRNDVLMEVVLGEALTDPLGALKSLNQLPPTNNRFYFGACVIAPEIAKEDLRKALLLVAPNQRRKLSPHSALSLSIIRLAHGKKPFLFLGSRCDFYPDCLIPRDRWPGPSLSQPLLF